jgi:hypothetical protein
VETRLNFKDYVLLIIQKLSSFLFYDVLDITRDMCTVYLDRCLVLAFNLGRVLDIKDQMVEIYLRHMFNESVLMETYIKN